MSKQEYYVTGKCKWSHRLFVPDATYEPANWSTVVYPDEPSLNIIQEWKKGRDGVQGILNHLKKDEDGYYINIRRPTALKVKGALVPLKPVLILNADGSPHPESNIGNGSDLTLKVEWRTYAKRPTGQGSAVRLVAVRINHLVPFVKEDFPDVEQRKQAEGMSEQPIPLF